MFFLFRGRKITKLAEAAKAYADANYQEPHDEPSSGAKYSLRNSTPAEPEEPKPKFSSRNSLPAEFEQSKPKFSSRSCDNYSARSVDLAMHGLFERNVPLSTLRELGESTNMSFVDKMLACIDSRRMRDSEVYKAAQIDRRLFSKIVSDRTYKPAKDTCIALTLALKLPLDESLDLLSRAGYTLSHSCKRDIVIEYFIREKIYDLNDINDTLYRLDMKGLGR